MLDNASNGRSASNVSTTQQSGTSNGQVTTSKAVVSSSQGRSVPARTPYSPADSEGVDVFKLLDQLAEMPEKAKHIRFLKTLVGFDEEQFYMLVLKIRANLPEDMKKAYRVAKDSARILDDARGGANEAVLLAKRDADRMLDAARAEAQRMVDHAAVEAARRVEQSEIHRMATAQAHDVLKHAETEASEIRKGADDHAHDVLKHAATEASEIRKGADDYARDVLTHLEQVMQNAIGKVQRGREVLEKARS